jgi:predicted Rossmann-fold nucleotide-binding protein
MLKVLVCGGRDYGNYEKMLRRLAELPKDTIVIQGGAKGADALAEHAAASLGLHTAEVRARWEKDGQRDKSAGPRRNSAMLALDPDRVIAFPGGRGTANCVRQAKERGIEVEEVASG